MSVQTEIDRIKNAKTAISTAIASKGVTVPNATLLDGMAALIDGIESGGGGPELLWTNAMPTSSFVSQPVDVASEYDGVLIECKFSNNLDVRGITYVPNGVQTKIFAPENTITSNSEAGYRVVTATNDFIIFSAGWYTDHAQNNNSAIPTRIWGVKWTL